MKNKSNNRIEYSVNWEKQRNMTCQVYGKRLQNMTTLNMENIHIDSAYMKIISSNNSNTSENVWKYVWLYYCTDVCREYCRHFIESSTHCMMVTLYRVPKIDRKASRIFFGIFILNVLFLFESSRSTLSLSSHVYFSTVLQQRTVASPPRSLPLSFLLYQPLPIALFRQSVSLLNRIINTQLFINFAIYHLFVHGSFMKWSNKQLSTTFFYTQLKYSHIFFSSIIPFIFYANSDDGHKKLFVSHCRGIFDCM